ncbi:unnamed protein product [Arabidopsis lyrata]|uniref:DUF220 domain-containing protein n=1 Tax=Arabidopsis lyrata subsp. lyrata TaxID=81972 RepID=D7KNG8_ARALL|nr:uncharacterized protein LOC9329351 [Arabidopsis lyrata subsp. lyrata]EFH69549.1 hypothetical protein ARALYDRAFT_889898 [Arabidopsis lyrata subsp. lyrata]CAH8253339.1 unnamed protein product [Arabidopsis lyrata]|eukprot:XP_002893290.1 uncharacterized protein LOC9329351 [Arabidopsis lyrata subsp. lyrata]
MVFTGFGGWVNQNNEQPRKAKPKITENVESKSESEMDTNDDYDKMKKYYDEEEMKKQDQLWIDAEKKHPWNDAPPKVKVTTKNGLCHMNIELTLGFPPDKVFGFFTDPSNGPFFLSPPLENKSRKVLMEDGPRQIAKVKKTVDWKFLGSSFAVPISVIVDENRKDLTAKYKKKKMILMKVFEGSYKVEPVYVDSERLCKNMEPKSPEDYKRCSGGQGRIASKVTMNQYFKPYPPFNLPPLSWYIREVTIKNTKTALKTLQTWGITLRNRGEVTSTDKDGNVTKSRRKKLTNKN